VYIWPIGTFCGQLVYFSPFWYVVPRKIWQPCTGDFAWVCTLEDVVLRSDVEVKNVKKRNVEKMLKISNSFVPHLATPAGARCPPQQLGSHRRC
jgi:hypothetical protein